MLRGGHSTHGFPGSRVLFWWLDGKESVCSVGDLSLIPGLEDPVEKGKATHSSILAWTEEPGALQSMGLQRAEHD